MRILQIIPTLQRNGTETAIMNIFRSINRDKYFFDFLIFKDTKDGYYQEAISMGAKVYYIPARKENPFIFKRNLEKFFFEHQGEFDVVHVNDMSVSSLAPLKAAKKYGVPIRIMHFHGSNCQGIHNKILHRINRLFIKKYANGYLGCSQSAIDWGYPGNKRSQKAVIIHNGVDPDLFKFKVEERNLMRTKLCLSEQDKILIHIGTFNEVKNHKFLLKIFRESLKKEPNLKLLLVGEGPLFNATKKITQNLEIEDKVIFLGKRKDISQLLAASDCLILPSLHEGLPMVLIEAQASGLPVITSTGVSIEAKASTKFIRIDLMDKMETWVNCIIDSLSLETNQRNLPEEINKFSIYNIIGKILEIYETSFK